MNICLAITNYAPQAGGLSTFYTNLSRLLAQEDHKVLILLADHQSSADDEDEISTEKNITKVLLKKSYHRQRNHYKKYFRPGGFEAHSWIANGIAARDWLLKNHGSFKIDIIQTPDYGGLGAFFADNELPPVVVFCHGCLTQLSKYNYVRNDSHALVLKKLEQLSFEHADAIMTHSPLNKYDLEKLTGRTVQFAIAPWKNDTDNAASSTGNAMIVASGLQTVKGAIVTAEAMHICAKRNSSLKVDWFGVDTYSAEKNQSMAAFLEKKFTAIWNKNLVWHNEKTRQEIKKQLASASVVVAPSLWETFGWTVLEAAAAGKAIIITDKTGAVYLFTHEHDAWIIPANDPEKLAEAIEVLNNKPDLCEKLGRNAKLMVQQVFDEKAIVEERIELFQKVIQNRKHHTSTFEDRIAFLKRYITPARRIYYQLRVFAKKFAGRS